MKRLQWQGQRSCPKCRSRDGFEFENGLGPVENKRNHLWPLLATIRCQSCRCLFIRNCKVVG